MSFKPLDVVAEVRCLWQAEALLGEGPWWWPATGCLYFIDIQRPVLFEFRPRDARKRVWSLPEPAGCAARDGAGGFIGAFRSGIARFRLEAEVGPPALDVLAHPEADRPNNRYNDGKVDALGRLWVGSMDAAERRSTGALYRVTSDGRSTRVLDGLGIANGLDWSPDGKTFYFTDSAARSIYAFDYVAGALAHRRLFARTEGAAGVPDGLTVDVEGGVWSAHWDGGCITRYRPDGGVDRRIEIPVPRPTSCAFGGADLDRLYITSASVGLTPERRAAAPLSGGLFEILPGVRGRPGGVFGG